jgi:hypothetical protein
MRALQSKFARSLAVVTLAGGAGLVTATPSAAAGSGAAYVCSGSPQSPGVLAGRHQAVLVEGVCEVNGGPATVLGNLTVSPGSALVAAFARNDSTGHGASRLSVDGDLVVQHGGALLLGCDPQSFACLDDPNQQQPTLSSPGYVGGSLDADGALGVIVHNTLVRRDVTSNGGGGGVNCTPQGIFAAFNSPAYSTYEDSTVGGTLVVAGMRSCWLGVNRVHVGRNVRIDDNLLADPDAIEILANDVNGNLSCHGNSMTWDGHELGPNLFPRADEPNTVGGQRSGQCVRATPTHRGGPYGPPNSF